MDQQYFLSLEAAEAAAVLKVAAELVMLAVADNQVLRVVTETQLAVLQVVKVVHKVKMHSLQ